MFSEFATNMSFKAAADRLFRGFWLLLVLGVFWKVGVFAQSDHAELTELSQTCFRLMDPLSCQKALIIAESLQNKAELRENYACQTMALGLASDLIMSQMKHGRGGKAYEVLDDVTELCDDLLG